MARIEIVNWSEHQHYKERTPPWIKLHRKLMNKRQWRELDGASAKLLIDLWMLAAESKEGALALNTADLAWQLRTDAINAIAACLIALQDKEFIKLVDHDASDVLATCPQPAIPEREERIAEPEVKAAVSTKPAAPPIEQEPDGVNSHGYFMPMLRKYGYDDDATNGSILKALFKRNLKPADIEAAIIGLSYMKAAGRVKGFQEQHKLSLRLLYANPKEGLRPIWNEAVEEYYRQQPKQRKTNEWGKGTLEIDIKPRLAS